jgi:hypothetical protein
MKKLHVLFLCSLCLQSCYIRSKKFWEHEEIKMQDCRKNWNYQELPAVTDVQILLFRNRLIFDRVYPAFIIGITPQKDTVAFIDKDIDTIFEVGEHIHVSPASWSPLEKVELDPIFSVYPKSKTNDLHCAVKTVYFGSFSRK